MIYVLIKNYRCHTTYIEGVCVFFECYVSINYWQFMDKHNDSMLSVGGLNWMMVVLVVVYKNKTETTTAISNSF